MWSSDYASPSRLSSINIILGVLAQGAKPEGSLERQDYERLRASFAGGSLAARLYAKWLTAFLDWIERFFGDVGMADRTLFPGAFGLKKPAPLWTAPALDRCLLLGLPVTAASRTTISTRSLTFRPASAKGRSLRTAASPQSCKIGAADFRSRRATLNLATPDQGVVQK